MFESNLHLRGSFTRNRRHGEGAAKLALSPTHPGRSFAQRAQDEGESSSDAPGISEPSAGEIWSTIRYLDPDSPRTVSDLLACMVLFWGIFVYVLYCAIHLQR